MLRRSCVPHMRAHSRKTGRFKRSGMKHIIEVPHRGRHRQNPPLRKPRSAECPPRNGIGRELARPTVGSAVGRELLRPATSPWPKGGSSPRANSPLEGRTVLKAAIHHIDGSHGNADGEEGFRREARRRDIALRTKSSFAHPDAVGAKERLRRRSPACPAYIIFGDTKRLRAPMARYYPETIAKMERHPRLGEKGNAAESAEISRPRCGVSEKRNSRMALE